MTQASNQAPEKAPNQAQEPARDAAPDVPTSALVVLMLGACAIGAAPILVRLAEAEGLGAQASAFWRLALAAPLTVLVLAWDRAPTTPDPGAAKRALWWSALAGLLFAGDLATWHAGIVRTSAANATLLANMTPVIIIIVAVTVLGERITGRFILGAAAALVGAGVLAGPNLVANDRSALLGDALCLATSLWYAAYMLAVRAARRVWSAMRVMAVSTAVAAPIAGLVAFGLGGFAAPVGLAWLWAWGLAGVHVAGQGGIAYGLGRLPASLSSVAVLVQPVVAAGLGAAVFADPLGPAQFIGGALVLAGVVAAHRSGAATPRPVARPPANG